MSTAVQRVMVWPVVLRLCHLVFALGVPVLLVTGGLLGSGMILNDALYQHLLTQWHLPAGHLVGLALVARLGVLVASEGVGGYRALWPRGQSLQAMLAFYSSLGRQPLPAYHAHNPFWGPLYLLFFGLLALVLVTGLMLEFASLRGLFGVASDPLLRWHLGSSGFFLAFTIGHVIASVLHDLRGRGADVSAMINGERCFEVERPATPPAPGATPSVSLDSLGRWEPPASKPPERRDR